MDTQKLFVEKSAKLEELSIKPKIFWYVSAGADFRGPVFLTQYHIDHEKKHHGRELQKPDLFVYNCLGPEVQKLKNQLSMHRSVVLFDDRGTRIEGKNYEILKLNNNINFQVNPAYIIEDHIENTTTHKEAFYFELEISFNNIYTETQKILYFESENIDFFDKMILSDYFETLYLCATREGLGFGNCRKSIIEYIYGDSHPSFYSDRYFKPKYNILFTDFTLGKFKEAIVDSEILTATENYVNYIQENQDDFFSTNKYYDKPDSIVYKIDYLV